MRILVIEARYHDFIADALMDGATGALEKGGAAFERAAVPGALEIPPAIALAARSGRKFDGYVALGSVIRGTSFHFEIIAAESAHGLMRLGIEQGLCIGNGILAADSEEEAYRMADPASGDAGGEAGRACLALIALNTRLGILS